MLQGALGTVRENLVDHGHSEVLDQLLGPVHVTPHLFGGDRRALGRGVLDLVPAYARDAAPGCGVQPGAVELAVR